MNDCKLLKRLVRGAALTKSYKLLCINNIKFPKIEDIPISIPKMSILRYFSGVEKIIIPAISFCRLTGFRPRRHIILTDARSPKGGIRKSTGHHTKRRLGLMCLLSGLWKRRKASEWPVFESCCYAGQRISSPA